ncbi:hypothetical protein H5410_050585, partial [Solanum commersonii]
LTTNDKFKSIDHRVLANKVGPRISLACFFMTNCVTIHSTGKQRLRSSQLISITKGWMALPLCCILDFRLNCSAIIIANVTV